jgi:hypothetical protein
LKNTKYIGVCYLEFGCMSPHHLRGHLTLWIQGYGYRAHLRAKGRFVETGDCVRTHAVEEEGVRGWRAIEASGDSDSVTQTAGALDVKVQQPCGKLGRQLQAEQVAKDVLEELVDLMLEAPEPLEIESGLVRA